MKKLIGFLTAFTAILAFNTFVFAQDTKTETTTDSANQPQQEQGFGKHRRGGKEGKMFDKHGGNGGEMMMRGLGRLNLSDAQKQSMKQLREDFKASTQAQHEEMKGLMKIKRDGGTFTPEQETRAKELRAQFREAEQAMQKGIEEILTPEQKDQLKKMHDEMKQKREERRQTKGQQPQDQF